VTNMMMIKGTRLKAPWRAFPWFKNSCINRAGSTFTMETEPKERDIRIEPVDEKNSFKPSTALINGTKLLETSELAVLGLFFFDNWLRVPNIHAFANFASHKFKKTIVFVPDGPSYFHNFFSTYLLRQGKKARILIEEEKKWRKKHDSFGYFDRIV